MTEVERGGCPVVRLDTGRDRPVGEWIDEFARLRRAAPVHWNEQGRYWILTRADHIREAFQDPARFTSDSVRPTDPDPPYRFIPSHVGPPRHVQYRQILNRAFSPAAVRRLEPAARGYCREVIDGLVEDGSCDVVRDFGGIFPTRVFLDSIGLPWEHAPRFVRWVEVIFDDLMSGAASGAAVAAMGEMRGYFSELLSERRAAPGAHADFVDHLLASTIDGAPLTDDDFLNIFNQLVLAGLDTVKSAIGYSLLHLATSAADRRRVVEDPPVLPAAVEELLRSYPLIMIGRKLGGDVDFHGAPMRRGDMVMLALPSAMRDEAMFPDADEVVLDRIHNNHFSFGAGPHRCLGAHLARMELGVALEEWHARIPEYQLAVDRDALVERGGQLALRSLPLRWDVATTRPRRRP